MFDMSGGRSSPPSGQCCGRLAPAARASSRHFLSLECSVAPSAATATFLTGFREGLRDAGYIEGQNVVIEAQWAEGEYASSAGAGG